MNNLYIVATPIGNLQDITLRAAHVLLSVPFIITESTSKSANLLEFLRKTFPSTPEETSTSKVGAAFTFEVSENKPKIISYSEDEEDLKLYQVIKILESSDAALISEAGTPLISDPGFKLVREAIKRGVRIVPIPGPTAAISALSASGLPTDKFLFLGFLSKSCSKKQSIFQKIKNLEIKTTIIIYESPDRLLDTLSMILRTLGDIDIVIARELTKIHEEIRREKVAESINYFSKTTPRGEFVILF